MTVMPSLSRRSFFYPAGLVAACLLGFLLGQSFLGDAPQPPQAVPSTDVPAPRRPVIGIASLTDDHYVRAVREAGGIPVVLPNTDGSVKRIEEYLTLIDGLLMPGGADIPPEEYGEQPHETVNPLDDARFEFERALCKAWIEQTDKPMLGICLGSQWINVASGGTLVQDIPSAFGVNHRGVNHSIELQGDSRLAGILGAVEVDVNSSHHQAVKDLGRNLRISACSPDGVVEATETTDPNRFLIGVQWHPERMIPDDQHQSKLLKAFIEASSGKTLATGAIESTR